MVINSIPVREKTGIVLLILVNSGFIYILIMLVTFSYGFFNGHSGLKASETANHIAESLINKVALLSAIVYTANYILFKMLLRSKQPIIGSLVPTILGVVISTPFFLREKQAFIDDQYSQIKLSDYIQHDSISEVSLFTPTDTIPIEYHRDFFQIIGTASYRKGVWKYQKTLKILILKTDGTRDSILTNGDLFELSNWKFFKAEENLVEKYFQISHAEKYEIR